MEYRRSKQQVYLLNYHLVWCLKRRRPVLVGEVRDRLKGIIENVAQELKIEILALEINLDQLISVSMTEDTNIS